MRVAWAPRTNRASICLCNSWRRPLRLTSLRITRSSQSSPKADGLSDVGHRPARREVPEHGAHGFLSPRYLHRHVPQSPPPERGCLTLPAFGRRRARRRNTEACRAGCCRVSRKPVLAGARGRSLGDGARGGPSCRPHPPGWLRPGQRCGWARARAPALGKRRRQWRRRELGVEARGAGRAALRARGSGGSGWRSSSIAAGALGAASSSGLARSQGRARLVQLQPCCRRPGRCRGREPARP